MSESYLPKVILPEIVLKPCTQCGHPRGSHRNNQECQVVGCSCKQFVE